MNGKLLRHTKRARVFLVWAVVLGVLGTVATIVQMALLGNIVARVFVSGAGLGQLQWPLALLLGAVVARSGVLWLREVVAQRGAVHAKVDLRELLFARLVRLGPAYAGGERTGELVSTTVEGIERLDAYFARYLPQVGLSGIAPFLIAFYVMTQDLLSGAILLFTAPAIPVLMVLIGKHTEKHIQSQWTTLSDMSAYFLDILQGLPTLRTFGRGGTERGRVAEVSDRFRRTTLGVLRRAFLSGLALELTATVSVALVAVTLGVRLLFGDLTFEPAFIVLLLAPEFYKPLRDLGTSRHAGMEGKAAAGRIFEVLNTPLPVEDSDAPANTSSEQDSYGNVSEPVTVEVRNATYTYPGSEDSALSGVDLTLPAGTRTALVGPSGSGKSTLVNLLLRFMDPEEGSILANGLPISELPVERWRERVALVPQQPYLFYGSVLDNIRLAKPRASREEVERAAKLAGAHDFIGRLSEGYETQVGERGMRLSGGEAQRLAIARAFLKDAPVVILDEPASHLDPESEERVEEALERLSEGRTVVVVAHRLGTARNADRVVVLDGGRVVEAGAHEELTGRGGLYARLVETSVREEVPGGERTSGAASGEVTARQEGHPEDREQGYTAGEGAAGSRPPASVPSRPRAGAFLRLLGFLRPYRWQVALAVGLGLWTVVSNLGLLAVSGYLIAAASLKPLLGTLILVMAMVEVFGGSRAFARYAERLVSHDVTFRLLADLRTWLYERLEPLSPARLGDRRSGDLLSRMVKDVEELENVYLRVFSPVVVATLFSGLVFGVLYVYAPPLAFATLGFMAFAGIGVPLLAGALERRAGRRQLELRADLNSRLVDGIQGLRDLLAFGAAADRREQVSKLGRRLGAVQRRTAFVAGLRETLGELANGLAVWTALVLAIPLVEGGGLRSVYLAFLVLAVLGSFEAVRPLGEAFQFLGRSTAAARRLFEITDLKPGVEDSATPRRAPSGSVLRFEEVGFRYEKAELPVLEDVSFTVEPGKRVAVVGPSGSGKSTLVNLLLRFWDPSSGRVLLDGHDLGDYLQEDLRAVFAVASQDAHLFDAPLRDNLLLARPDATDAEMLEALEKVRLGEFVERLPRGLGTPLGEQGVRLSGGERRRLAISRAFLKDAPLLVLDEPTANLDAGTERGLMDEVQEISSGKGLLLITHRLVRLEKMDEILVLENGRVVERGTHDELIENHGLYRRMVEVQDRMLAAR